MLHKPLILLGTFWRPLLQSVSHHLVISPKDLALLHIVESSDKALELLSQLI
jgi:hypothetical protein